MRALVFSIDDVYVMPFKVLWHSLMKTDSIPEGTPVFVLHESSLSKSAIEDLSTFLQQYRWSASFRDASHQIPDDLPLRDGDHVSKATFYRLFVCSILPETIDSAVYIDSDTLVVRNISDLFSVQLTAPVAAADHLSYSNALRLWGDAGGSYFQAGVMIINLNSWRSLGVEDVFQSVMTNERDRICWWDQDVLNITFFDKWQRLPIWYNTGAAAIKATSREAADQHARLLHFDGSNKPWKGDTKRAFSRRWFSAYQEVFGEPFDLSKVGRPLWIRIASLIKSRIHCLLFGS